MKSNYSTFYLIGFTISIFVIGVFFDPVIIEGKRSFQHIFILVFAVFFAIINCRKLVKYLSKVSFDKELLED